MIDGLAGHAGPWRLHVFGVYHDSGALRPRRCQLIRDKIGSLLQKKQRRLLRSLTAGDGPWLRGEALVQVGLPMPDTGFLSICDADLRFRLRRMVAPFCGGIAGIAADRRAPSRAFAKLIEAELRLGRRIEAGQTCVDLGSSPGSWAYVALERGARVLAVDRSPLRADLMAHPALAFVRGDAFGYRPAERVDWLLCDVIAPAERIIELLQTWVAERWCRRFCVTIKFRGTSDYAILEPLKSWLAAADVEFILRRLTNNKNEITAIGELPDDLADCRIEFPEN
jgi:23S rRNA (cytidine2498-2'-O)-methyltransferase